MSFAHDRMSVFGGVPRRLVSSSALPLTTLLLTIGSLPLPMRPQTG
jgi:hypothetical protein